MLTSSRLTVKGGTGWAEVVGKMERRSSGGATQGRPAEQLRGGPTQQWRRAAGRRISTLALAVEDGAQPPWTF